jgi:hypothetical protein
MVVAELGRIGQNAQQGSRPEPTVTHPPGPTRRGLLSAVGAAAAGVGALAGVDGAGAGDPDELALRVRVYADDRAGWTEPMRAAVAAVATGLDELAGAVARHLDRPVRAAVERGPTAPRAAMDYGSQDALLDSLRAWLDDTDAPEGPVAHLLLADAPLNPSLGYGGTATHVAADRLGGRTVVNVGATEGFDSRAVTRAMAVHETLHTLVMPPDAAAVNDSRCEHDLGAVARLRLGEVVVTPLATSYAANGTGETAFHGTGCYDHDAFSMHEAALPDDRLRWHHTVTPSPATKRAVARYLDRSLSP